ncbi:GNAT family N-acetyltransferase [Maribacter thermophilus]|uniref:GNAT family N-acetyltransferase n=1 Tax=Maribacter thermophilus TaxID=1197874 RepID=UPI00064181B5|nr:GNAT family N-acetyltransferase [Maribacter thermophilus]
METDFEVTDNPSQNRYEARVENAIAKIEYTKKEDKIYLTHTEVPQSLAGKGIGSKLISKVLEDIEQKQLKLIPLCSFVASYLQRYPEWNKLVIQDANTE